MKETLSTIKTIIIKAGIGVFLFPITKNNYWKVEFLGWLLKKLHLKRIYNSNVYMFWDSFGEIDNWESNISFDNIKYKILVFRELKTLIYGAKKHQKH